MGEDPKASHSPEPTLEKCYRLTDYQAQILARNMKQKAIHHHVD
jgi:hypothetical protein